MLKESINKKFLLKITTRDAIQSILILIVINYKYFNLNSISTMPQNKNA